VPDRLRDETRLRLDLMPYEERTVQPYGIVMEGIEYYDDVLRPWINAVEPGDATGKRTRKFIVRRDPRDISVVYFFDPELTQYSAQRRRLHQQIAPPEVADATALHDFPVDTLDDIEPFDEIEVLDG
jgi:hypothetical protein